MGRPQPPAARPSQGKPTSAPRPVNGRGLGHVIPRPQARPLLRHTGAGRAGLSGPQAASRDRAFWAGLRRGRASHRTAGAARAAAKLRPCADALAAAWAGGELKSDAQIGRERARSAKGGRGQPHGNYALNAHLAHKCPPKPHEKGNEKRRRGGAVRAGTCGGGTVFGAKLFAKVTTLAKRLAHDDCWSQDPRGGDLIRRRPVHLGRVILSLAVALFDYPLRAWA